MYIYGNRGEKWDPYSSKGKAYENAKDVWTRNQVKITTKKKNKGVQRREWIRKVKEWAEGGYEKVDDWVPPPPPPPPPPPVLWQHLEQVFVKHSFAYACNTAGAYASCYLASNKIQFRAIGLEILF